MEGYRSHESVRIRAQGASFILLYRTEGKYSILNRETMLNGINKKEP